MESLLVSAFVVAIAEIGDKTQIATVALGARFHDVLWVAAGTTLGMMAANIPAVYLGEAATKIVPLCRWGLACQVFGVTRPSYQL